MTSHPALNQLITQNQNIISLPVLVPSQIKFLAGSQNDV